MKLAKKGIVAAAALAMTGFGFGCSSNNNTSGGSIFSNPPSVDIAVVTSDAGSGYGFSSNGMLSLYLDPFANGGIPFSPDASIAFDDFVTGGGDISHAYFYNGDLYISSEDASDSVCNASVDGSVFIFRDYVDMTDASLPDVELCNDVTSPRRFFIANDTLIVPNPDDSEVSIWTDLDNLTTGQAADYELSTDVSNPVDAEWDTENDVLFVANTPTGTSTAIGVYNDFSAIAADQAPDVTLDEDTSFLDTDLSAKELAYSDNNLFVSFYDASYVMVFDTDGIADNDLPVAVLINNQGLFNSPTMTVSDGTLFAGPGRYDCVEDPGSIVGYSPVGSFVDGQNASFEIPQTATHIWAAQEVVVADGALFAAGYTNCNFEESALAIFNSASSLTSYSLPDFLLEGEIDGYGSRELSFEGRLTALAVIGTNVGDLGT